MFISYDIRNGVEYAKLCISKRNGKVVSKSYIYLGKVIDKKNFIFQNRDRGTFKYNPIDNSYTTIDENTLDRGTYTASTTIQNTNNQQNTTNYITENKYIPTYSEYSNHNATELENVSIDDYKPNNQTFDQQEFEQQQPKQIPDYHEIYSQSTTTQNDQLQQEYPFQTKENKNPNNLIKNMLKDVVEYGNVAFVKKIIEEEQLDYIINMVQTCDRPLLYVAIYNAVLNTNTDISYWYSHSYIKRLYPNADIGNIDAFTRDINNNIDNFFSSYQQKIIKKLDASIVDLSNKYIAYNRQGYPICWIENQNIADIIHSLELDTECYIANLDVFEELTSIGNVIAEIPQNQELYTMIMDIYTIDGLELINFNNRYYHLSKGELMYHGKSLYTYVFSDILKQSYHNIDVLENNMDIKYEELAPSFDIVAVSNENLAPELIIKALSNKIKTVDDEVNTKNVVNFLSRIIKTFAIKHLKIPFQDALLQLRNIKCYLADDSSDDTLENDINELDIYNKNVR